MNRSGASFFSWLEDRAGLGKLTQKEIPLHRHTGWYYWGGATLFLILVQVITGLLLAVYYQPGAGAFESVKAIDEDIDFGYWIRSVHFWAATLLVLSLLGHMFSVFFMRAYRRPRDLTWMGGILLLLLILLLGFTGSILRMDERSYFTGAVGIELVRGTPILGGIITPLLFGEDSRIEAAVHRFYVFHAMGIPILVFLLLALHLWLLQVQGMAKYPPEGKLPDEERRSLPFLPDFMRKELVVWILLLAVCGSLAYLLPAELGEKGDVLKPTPTDIHPEWYFLGFFQAIRALGRWLPGAPAEFIVGLISLLILLLWTLLPFWDPPPGTGVRARLARGFGLLLLLAFIAMTAWGYLRV